MGPMQESPGRTDRSIAGNGIGRRPTSYRSKASKWERPPRWPARRSSGNAMALEPEEWESGTTRRQSPRETVVVLVRGDVLRGVVRWEETCTTRLKPSEPQGRQQATSLRHACGENRRDGEKP